MLHTRGSAASEGESEPRSPLSPEDRSHEEHLVARMVAARQRWQRTFLETPGALKAVWTDLELWASGEIAASGLVATAPTAPRPDGLVGRIARIFEHERLRWGEGWAERPERRRRLVTAVLHAGFLPSRMDAWRKAAASEGDARLRRSIERARSEFLRLRGEVVESNLRLTHSVARKLETIHHPAAELAQEGHLGLLRATETFHPRHGARFATYAHTWIRQRILAALENTGRTIRLPVSVQRAMRRLEKTSVRQDGLPPRAQRELEELMALPTIGRPLLSIEAPVLDEDAPDMRQVVPDERTSCPTEEVMEREQQQALGDAVEALPAEQKDVVRLRFGLLGETHTLREVAARLGLTTSRVRQLEQQALARLRSGREGGKLRSLLPA